MQIDEILHREGEGRWERGEKPKAMVMLKEEGAQEAFDKVMVLNKEMVLNEVIDNEEVTRTQAIDKDMMLNKRTNRRLERVAIKPWLETTCMSEFTNSSKNMADKKW